MPHRGAARLLFAALMLASPAQAQEQSQAPADIWAVPLGAGVDAVDAEYAFIDHACGTAGGPPSRRLSGFAEFRACRQGPDGLREVYFRYDDQAELVARALEQSTSLLKSPGTTAFGFPVIASLLIDDSGTVVGRRLVTDPRPENATDRARFEFWTLGNLARNWMSLSGWRCEELPLGDGAKPASAEPINRVCGIEMNGEHTEIRQTYFQKRGQVFFASDVGRYNADAFESTSWIETRQAGPAGAAP